MLKIGEFSKLSHLTIKTLRFYEKKGILIPFSIDKWTGYRFFETSQLEDASKIKAFRQLGLSIEEIKSILNGKDVNEILQSKKKLLIQEREHINSLLSTINFILGEQKMKYQIVEKVIPKTLVYYSETTLKNYSEIMEWIPSLGEKCLELNPNIKCAEPPYEFCEYLDCEHKETNIKIRHNEAVKSLGKENDIIKFREIPETKVLSVFHKGAYDNIGEAYAYIVKYAEENNYKISGFIRECYIDGIWNKDNVEDWLTEIQLPIE